jgi:hypothetical protein
MNSESGDNKGTAGRRIGGGSIWAYAGVMVAGFVLGVGLDARYRPNHIVFEVQPDTKVNLAPYRGDIIEWKSSNPQSTSTGIRFFSSKVPCSEPNGGNQCTFAPLTVPQVYLYDCALDKTPSTCYDPGIGPSSTSGGGHASKFARFVQTIKDIVVILGVDLERLFGIWPKPTAKPWLQAVGTTIAGPAAAGGTPPPRHINVAVDCDKGGKSAVFPDGNPADENNAIEASVGDSITWQPYTAYSIGDLSVCSPAPLKGNPGSPAGNNLTCTLKSGSGDVQYTLKTSGCANLSSITEHIKLP